MKLKRGKKAFVRVFGTIRYATLKTGDKGVTPTQTFNTNMMGVLV